MPCKPPPRGTTARRNKATETPEDEQLGGSKEGTAYEVHLWRTKGVKDLLKEDFYFLSILLAVRCMIGDQESIVHVEADCMEACSLFEFPSWHFLWPMLTRFFCFSCPCIVGLLLNGSSEVSFQTAKS